MSFLMKAQLCLSLARNVAIKHRLITDSAVCWNCLQLQKQLLQNRQGCLPSSAISRRLFSSTQNPSSSPIADVVKKKRRPRKRAQYTECIEVTETSASHTKAKVNILKPKQLSKAVACSQAQLPMVYETPSVDLQTATLEDAGEEHIADLLASDRFPLLVSGKNAHFVDTELLEEEIASRLHDDHDHVTIANEEPSPQLRLEAGKDIKKGHISSSVREKTAKVSRKVLDKASKEAALVTGLHSYLQLCVSQGNLNRAVSTLRYYRNKYKHSEDDTAVKGLEVYNTVLRGAAKKHNVHALREVMRLMKESAIVPDAQSYAACFECLGRLAESQLNKISESEVSAKALLEEMRQTNLQPSTIFQNCFFEADEKTYVLQGIRLALRDFVPEIPYPNPSYECALVNKLNDRTLTSKMDSVGEGTVTAQDLLERSREQVQVEIKGYVCVESIDDRDESNINFRKARERLEQLEVQWRSNIRAAVERDLATCKSQYSSRGARDVVHIYPFLATLPASEYVELIMQEVRTIASGSENYSPSLSSLCRNLGVAFMNRYHLKAKVESGVVEKVQRLYTEYCDWYLKPQEDVFYNPRQKWQQLQHGAWEGPDIDVEDVLWPPAVLSEVGHFLYNILLNDLKIDINPAKKSVQRVAPAFYILYRSKGTKVHREVKPHPVVAKLWQEAAGKELVFPATSLPMLAPPLPWTSHRTGGYLLSEARIIRLPPQAHQQKQRLAAAPPQNLYPALDALNCLGSIPWKINTKILDLVIDIFRKKGSKELDVAQPPSECAPAMALQTGMSGAERAAVFKDRQIVRRKKAEMYSLWCDSLYRLSLANYYRDRVFWFPHNMDFRGRVYPCPPHLNHLSSDLARALLCFAQGKPLGAKGLDWLKTHLINLTGLKKREPVAARLEYANSIMDDILDSADNPLGGRGWWKESEEPWQTLSTCIEVAAAVRSPNPEEYVCHLPLHQDGSCNGLQHYAALGRDQAGAVSVNLAPSYEPQDVYSSVAALVERERAREAAEGLPIAKVLEGLIKRKVIKQTVMTTVYGVTRFGARLQIAKQLKDLPGLPQEHLWQASHYLVNKTFNSLHEMFTSAREIQDWFTDCAKLISQVCGQNVEWLTPLGLPVVQPYSRSVKVSERPGCDKPVKTANDCFERPNMVKQRNAFPPNFIHSLDSCHMMLTALYCQRQGITFASVHDCFWTHASSVDAMNKVCREQFVALHAQPILEDLSNFMIEKYGYKSHEFTNDGSVQEMTKLRLNHTLAQVPSRGSFDLTEVLKSVYFFS